MSDFRNKSVDAFKWNTLDIGTSTVLQLIYTIILMRLLTSYDMGVFAIPFLVVSFFRSIQDFELSNYIIRHKIREQSILSTFFLSMIGMGIGFFLLLYFSAPLIRLVTQNQDTIHVLKVLSIGILCTACYLTSEALLRSEMAFKKLFFINFIAINISGIFGILLAVYDPSPMVLAYRFVAYVALLLLFNWLVRPLPLTFSFDKKHLSASLPFTLPSVGSQFVQFFSKNLDSFAVGRWMGMVPLGLYDRANKLTLMPIGQIAQSFVKIMLPTMADVQQDDIKLQAVFLKINRLVLLTICPVVALVLGLAPLLVHVIFTEKWMPIVPMMYNFALLALVQALMSMSAPVFMVKDTMKTLFTYQAISQGILAFALVCSSYYYREVVLLSRVYIVVSVLLMMPLWSKTLKELGISSMQYWKHIQTIVMASVVIGLMLYKLEPALSNYFGHSIFLIIFLTLCTIIGYVFAIRYFHNELYQEVYGLFKLLKSQIWKE